MSLATATEMARCAKINIENMVKMMPILATHPLLPIVRIQIDECVEELEKMDEYLD